MHKNGFSLIEILIVIALFSVLAVVVTQSLTTSLIGSRKSDSTVKIRENLEYATSVLERRIRNSQSIENIAACSISPGINRIDLLDADNNPFWFQCSGLGGSSGRIETDSGLLTSDEINVTNCYFLCVPASPGVPPRILISITAEPKQAVSTNRYPVSISTTISLRVY